ncbi:MFS transporter [Candidatus Curtissbacteria bacterium]|nr:MFS transporter [Candidatus Curtissbacteria bacterium]
MAKKDILIAEQLEISTRTGAAAPFSFPPTFLSIFPAFAHRNFQLYVAGQAISLVGFWLHQVASGWLVFELTGSAFWVGTTAAIGGLPFLIFTTTAGVFIDKLNKQKLLIATQVTEAAIAILLGIIVLTEHANLTIVLILAFLNGAIGAIDLPTRLTFIVEMVGKRDLASAIPINNGLFNAARFIGPALAGVIIATHGVGWPFILNGLSFIAGIWAISNIRPIYSYEVDVDTRPLDSLKTGFKFAFGHEKIFYFIILGFASAILIWPFQTLMPLVAERVFTAGANGYGSLLSAAGAGSLAGAIFISAMSRRENKSKFILMGLLISSLSLLIFSVNRNFLVAHLLLAVSGFGILMKVSTLNTLVQLASPDQMRARVMAVYLTMFVGMMPLGNELAGIVAHQTSAMFTIGLGAVLMLIVGITLYIRGIFSNLLD